MNVSTASPAQRAIDELQGTINGRIVEPSDPDFDKLSTIVMGGVNARPAALVRPVDAAEVARVVAVAARSGVELAIRGGGHSGAGHGTVDGGLVLDLRELRTLDVDPGARTAWAGAAHGR